MLALAFGVAEWSDPDAGRPSLIFVGAMLVAAVAWYRFVLKRRPGGWAPRVRNLSPAARDGRPDPVDRGADGEAE